MKSWTIYNGSRNLLPLWHCKWLREASFFFFLSTKDSTIFIIGFKVNTPSGLIAKIKFKTNNNRRNPKGGGGVFPFYVDRKWACQGCRRQRSDPLECDSLGYQEYKTNSIFIRKHLWHFLPLHYQCIWKQQQIQKKKKHSTNSMGVDKTTPPLLLILGSEPYVPGYGPDDIIMELGKGHVENVQTLLFLW